MYLNVNNIDVHECIHVRETAKPAGGGGGKKNTSFRFSERGVSSVSGGQEEGWGAKKGENIIFRVKSGGGGLKFFSLLSRCKSVRAPSVSLTGLGGPRDGQCAQGDRGLAPWGTGRRSAESGKPAEMPANSARRATAGRARTHAGRVPIGAAPPVMPPRTVLGRPPPVPACGASPPPPARRPTTPSA